MLPKIISLAKKFVAIESTSQNPKDLKKILGLALANLRGYAIERFERNGFMSALIYNSKKRPGKFKIMLNGHLDVIPGKKHQYAPRIKSRRLYGAGSMDMKASVACLIMVFNEVAANVNYPLALQLVTDEEVGGRDGTKYQIEQGVRADFVIAGESTNFDIVNKTKGILWLEISAKGSSAHGAYPWRGENAVWKMNEFLNVLKATYPILRKEKWITTVNLSRIETSNQAFNKIPDDCIVGLDVRYIPEESRTIIRSIRKLLPKGFTLDIIENEPALHTDDAGEYISALKKTGNRILGKKLKLRGAHGTSDARHFARVNCPGIEFGPVGGGIGSDQEWVDIPSLETYYRVLKHFLSSVS